MRDGEIDVHEFIRGLVWHEVPSTIQQINAKIDEVASLVKGLGVWGLGFGD